MLAIANVVGSRPSPRESDRRSTPTPGPEIGVASTKAFTAQLAALTCSRSSSRGATARSSPEARACRLKDELLRHPRQDGRRCSSGAAQIEELARRLRQARNFLFLGRGISYPVALEGALKLKEITYIHAEGYPAGEMKHGPSR